MGMAAWTGRVWQVCAAKALGPPNQVPALAQPPGQRSCSLHLVPRITTQS